MKLRSCAIPVTLTVVDKIIIIDLDKTNKHQAINIKHQNKGKRIIKCKTLAQFRFR